MREYNTICPVCQQKITEPRRTHCSHACANTARKPLPSTRFWSKVDNSGGPDACWPWLASRDKDGYGRFSLTHEKRIPAHRFAWELVNGPMQSDLLACHSCDNPPCCNPAHIFPGTQAVNQADKAAKGRAASGERNGMVKYPERCHTTRLTREQVREIRAIFDQPNPPLH